MTSDVVLTAALRSNLLSLQNTQSLIDITQFRLASGRKINSALDGPQSFFASQALNNRASDLTRLLDNVGQSIQVIKAADNGVTALTKLVEQADSVAQSARDALAEGQTEAKIVGSRDLRAVNNIDALPGTAAGDILRFSVTDANGVAVSIGAFGGAAAATADITIAANQSSAELVTAINNLNYQIGGVGNAVGEQVFQARLNEAGQLEVKMTNGGDFRLQFVSLINTDAGDIAFAADLGLDALARAVPDGSNNVANNSVEIQALSDVALNSFRLARNANGDVALRSDLITTLRNRDTAGFPLIAAGIDNANDNYQIGINGGAMVNIPLFATVSTTIQGFIDSINNNTTLNTQIRAEFDDATGRLTIRPISGDVQSVEVGVTSGAVGLSLNWGFGRNGAGAVGAANGFFRETLRLASAAGDLAQFETDYNNLRAQIDALVEDTGYRGTNLLNGDDLTTFFNEDRSNFLTTSGQTFTASGLGLSAADFGRESSVDAALDDVRTALESVRNFGSSLANNLSIIQTRESFMTSLVNTLKEGADKLTVADQNEEGAKLLALQTRQQLGVTSLALASQSQQSILRLF